MKKLEGKVALITGAAVGLGKGIATVLYQMKALRCALSTYYQKSKKRKVEKPTAPKCRLCRRRLQ